MSQDRIKRSVFYCIIAIIAGLAGFFVQKVLIEGGVFSLSTAEIIETTLSGVLIGLVVPIIEANKKNR